MEAGFDLSQAAKNAQGTFLYCCVQCTFGDQDYDIGEAARWLRLFVDDYINFRTPKAATLHGPGFHAITRDRQFGEFCAQVSQLNSYIDQGSQSHITTDPSKTIKVCQPHNCAPSVDKNVLTLRVANSQPDSFRQPQTLSCTW